MTKLYERWMRSCEQAGIEPFGIHTSAKLAAIVHVYTPSEQFTHNPMAVADMAYIQRRYNLHGGGVPEQEFIRLLRMYVKDLEEKTTKKENGTYAPAEWASQMFEERYGIKVFV